MKRVCAARMGCRALAVCLVIFRLPFGPTHLLLRMNWIINEWSQGNGGSKEWVELLVVSGPQDLRGWSLSDKTPTDLTFRPIHSGAMCRQEH